MILLRTNLKTSGNIVKDVKTFNVKVFRRSLFSESTSLLHSTKQSQWGELRSDMACVTLFVVV